MLLWLLMACLVALAALLVWAAILSARIDSLERLLDTPNPLERLR